MPHAIEKRLFRLAGAAFLLLLGACGGDSDGPPPAPPPAVGSATIGPAGGTVDGPDGTKLVVPPDALTTSTTFRIARTAAGAPELIGLNAASPVYEVTPHDTEFGAPALFSLPLSAGQIPDGTAPLLLKASPGKPWRVVNDTGRVPGALSADLDSLSWYVLASCRTSNAGGGLWVIGAPDCPTNNQLKLELLDFNGTPIAVVPGDGGVLPPLVTVTGPTTLNFRLTWTRPNTTRTDYVAVTGSGGFRQGFSSNWGAGVGPVIEVRSNYTAGFSVTIDPERIGSREVRVTASAGYSTTAFAVGGGGGSVGAGFEFETFIPIRVRYTGTAPTITQPPANAGVVEGQPATFNVVATISPAAALTYQWFRRGNANATFAPIAGATQASYTLFSTTLADNGAQFQVEVCVPGTTRCATSAPATLTVTRAPVAPSFTMQPASLAVSAGQTASFTAMATGVPAPSIRWQTAAAGSTTFSDLATAACPQTPATASGDVTSATCTVGPVSTADNGRRYRAIAINAVAAPGVPSNEATLTVTPAPAAPSITTHPAAQSTTVGGSATFTVVASGTAPLAYTWQINGTALPGSGDFTIGTCTGTVSGSGASLTLTALSAGCNGTTITVVVANGISPDATSTPVTLTVLPAAASGGACFGGATGWCYVQPAPNANRLRALAFTSTGELVVGGGVGTFQRSTDFGSTWTVRWTTNASNERHGWVDLALPTDSRIVAISDVSSGINSAPAGIYVSDNGGASWTLAQAEEFLSSLAFQDASVGVAVSSVSGRIWRTTNGGSAWTQQTVAPVGVVQFTRVAHAGGTVFVAVGEEGAIWRSADSGQTWSSVTSGVTDALTDIAFNGAGIGLVVRAGQRQLLRSADFGVSWQSVNIPMSASAVGFASATVAAVLGDISGESIRSTDAGVTWSSPNFDLSSGPQNWRMRFASATTGIAVGNYGAVARTANGGQSWTRIAGGTAFDRVEDLQASPDRSVVLGSFGGEVKRSVDGGRTWSDPASGRQGMNGFSWGSNTVALGFVSSVGVYRTDDAGQSWAQVLTLPPSTTSQAVAMASATVAIAARNPSGAPVGQGGVLERTTDGGNTWAPVSLPGATDFWVVVARFASSTLGYVGGTGLWRTTDGGANWTRLTLPAPSSGVEFVSDIHVTPGGVLFIVTGDAVLRSTDQGATFTSVLDNQFLGAVRRIAFVDGNVGLGVGAGGIYRTSDAGLTWTRLDLPLDESMFSVAWANATTPLVGGESAALLRNQAIGQPAAPPPVLRQSVRSRPTPTVVTPAVKRLAPTPHAAAATRGSTTTLGTTRADRR